jgi:hypothetical protein
MNKEDLAQTQVIYNKVMDAIKGYHPDTPMASALCRILIEIMLTGPTPEEDLATITNGINRVFHHLYDAQKSKKDSTNV